MRITAAMKTSLEPYGITRIDGIMMDLGVSSPQFDDSSRGFSYRYDGVLDMRMDQSQTKTAYQIVNAYTKRRSAASSVTTVRSATGNRSPGQLSRRRRTEAPIATTFELVDVIKSVLPPKELSKKGHPAKQTFQALRIEVNDELVSLSAGLSDACAMLKVGGRLRSHLLPVPGRQDREGNVQKHILCSICGTEDSHQGFANGAGLLLNRHEETD
jgi:16S rRNA (cytosine1402-N4)-methyltransferase